MADQRKGPTTRGTETTQPDAGAQLELAWVPPASPAVSDFVCWLWAAFPPREGRLNVSRIAGALEISTTTLWRWIAQDSHKLEHAQIQRLHQRAILRGKGHYLWPDLDPTSRRRSELIYADAIRNDQLIRTAPDRVAPAWRENGTTSPHDVQIVLLPQGTRLRGQRRHAREGPGQGPPTRRGRRDHDRAKQIRRDRAQARDPPAVRGAPMHRSATAGPHRPDRDLARGRGTYHNPPAARARRGSIRRPGG